MTSGPVRRFEIGGLSVLLPPYLEVTDGDLLDRHLAPFAAGGDGSPDVTLDLVPGPRPDPPAAGFRVDVTRVTGPPEAASTSEAAVFVVEDGVGVRVVASARDAMDVVLALQVGLAHLLPRRGGLMLHASVVRAAGRGFVFPGPSGAGKTTAARRFSGGTVLSDERCVVRRIDGAWGVGGVPMWGGNYEPAVPDVVPMGMIVLIRKSVPLGVASVSPADAAERLAASLVHYRYDAASSDRVIGALAMLVSEVPVAELSYGLGESFAPALLARIAGRGSAAIGLGGAS